MPLFSLNFLSSKPVAHEEGTAAASDVSKDTAITPVQAPEPAHIALPASPPASSQDMPAQLRAPPLATPATPPPTSSDIAADEAQGAQSSPPSTAPVLLAVPSGTELTTSTSATTSSASAESAQLAVQETKPSSNRRWSMKNLTAWRSEAKLESSQSPKRSGTLHTLQEEAKRQKAAEALVKRASKVSASDRKAKESAYVVRSLIVGPTLSNMPRPSGATKAQVNKVKGQLLESRTANKVIAQLRALPIAEAPIATAGDHSSAKIGTATKGHGPIHAVCLPFTESEAAGKHFASAGYKAASSEGVVERALEDVPSIATATVETAVTMFQDLHIVDLLAAPNMGLGAPGDAPGILSGAIPTAETVINGITQITPQLMNLGYAMGKAVYVNHEGVYPPTDRMSILTYWWGLELVLPPPSIAFLSHAPSIAHAIINFLTAMSVANSGVREVLPFIRYISQYVDFEFGVIQKMDQGQGVVCAATWIMPAALVPRPWDFPPPPPPSASAQAPAEVDSGTQTDTSGAVPSSPPETAPSSSSPPGLPTSGATPQPPSIPVAQPLPNPGIPATVPTSSPSITVTTATLPRHAEPPVTA